MPENERKISYIRNVGIMAHIDAGKTTTTERILYQAGKIRDVGEVHEGEAKMDFMDQEQERGITIQSAATTVYWKENQINIIDTPGHVDFTAEVERSLRVLDGGIVVLDGKEGVESQTETVWRQANKYKIPRLIFINKMDGVDNIDKFDKCLESVVKKLNAKCLVVQFPIGAGKELEGIVDIIKEKACYFQMGDKKENYQVKEIPSNLLEQAQKSRRELVEKIIEVEMEKTIEENQEESLVLKKYWKGDKLSEEEIKKLIRQATLTGRYFPVFCGSAYKHVGIKLLLDGVVDYLPSPLDIAEIPVFTLSKRNETKENVVIEEIKTKIAELEKSIDNLALTLSNPKIPIQKIENKTDKAFEVVKFEMEEEVIELKKQLKQAESAQTKINCQSPLSCLALAFKITVDNKYKSKLTFFRVYAGKVSTNSYIYNVSRDKIEKIGRDRLVRIHANEKEKIEEVGAGDIAAAVGLEHTITGDTWGEEKKPLLLETIDFVEPVISQAIEPKTDKDKDKLFEALDKLKIQDPSFKYWTDRETRQIIIAGMGELHLEVLIERLRREYKLDVESKQPKVSYRETMKEEFEKDEKGNKRYKKIVISHLHKKQTGGAGQRAEIKLEFKPNPGEGFKFVNALRGEKVGKGNCYVPAIEKGLLSAFSEGPLLGYPVVDIEVTLIDGAYHPVDSSDLAFETASRDAFQENVNKSNTSDKKINLVLLEPIMQIEVVVPKEYMGDVLASLGSRRTIIENTEEKENNIHIRGESPLNELLNYSTILRQLTKGRGSHSITPSHYQEVPKNSQEEMLKEQKAKYC
ncbi:elongation factor G [endosymbiont GvMRE of Glomus versiforme]|uniref:elongation factor G n=1 Tax=endosymbiont GvMRE of Glomus versiforme TaxID=2039283 RepID=UPI000EBC2259|nr:elongation factor G [endosymbiont GvMRE of Glomus versiforme]RHZ35464.1 Elongation factor G [endosymbiont GvMRE of Glomus versiforme]